MRSWLPAFISLKTYLGLNSWILVFLKLQQYFQVLVCVKYQTDKCYIRKVSIPYSTVIQKHYVSRACLRSWGLAGKFHLGSARYDYVIRNCVRKLRFVFNLPQLEQAILILQNVRLLLFCTSGRNLHFFISFCSSYGGLRNASAKNQIEFTHHRNGRKANPAARDGSHYRRS